MAARVRVRGLDITSLRRSSSSRVTFRNSMSFSPQWRRPTAVGDSIGGG